MSLATISLEGSFPLAIGKPCHIRAGKLLVALAEPIPDPQALLLICRQHDRFILVGKELGERDTKSVANLGKRGHRRHVGLMKHGVQGRVRDARRLGEPVV